MGTRKHTICVKHFPFTTFFFLNATSHFAVRRQKLGTPPIRDKEAHIKYLNFKTHQHHYIVTKASAEHTLCINQTKRTCKNLGSPKNKSSLLGKNSSK